MADKLDPQEPQDPLYSENRDERMDEPEPEPVTTVPETPEKVLRTIPISSSHILSAQYDDDAQQMVIEFQNGSRYRYSNVDPVVFTAFMDSPSKGNYLHKVIRQVCPCEKL